MKASKHTALTIVAQEAPLQVNADGVFLVGIRRVTLDTVVAVFNPCAIAKEITERYSSLKLTNELASIAFYLNHQQEVKADLKQRQQQALAPLVHDSIRENSTHSSKAITNLARRLQLETRLL